MMAERDKLLEDIYTLIQRTDREDDAADAARIGLLAVQFRLNQRKRQRMERAIAKQRAERAQLRASIRQPACDDIPVGGAACLSPGPHATGEGDEQ